MTISILTDSEPKSRLNVEHGLLYLIEHNGISTSLNNHQSKLFLQDANRKGIAVSKVNLPFTGMYFI